MEQLETEIRTGNEVIDNQLEGASNLMKDMTEMDKVTDKMRDGEINGCNLHQDEETENKEDANAVDTAMVQNPWIIDEIVKKFDGIEDHQGRLQEMIRKLPAEDLRQLEAILRLDDRHLRVKLIQFHRRSTRNAFFQIESDCIMDEILEIFYHQIKKHFDNVYQSAPSAEKNGGDNMIDLTDNSGTDDKIDLAVKSGRDDKIGLSDNIASDDKTDSNQERMVAQSLDLRQVVTEFTHNAGVTIQDSSLKTKMPHKGANSVLAQIRNLRSRILNAFVGKKADKSSVKQPKARKEKRKIFSCFAF